MKTLTKFLMPMLLLVAGLGISPNAWAAETFTKGQTLFFFAKNNGDNAWKDGACVKAWFNDGASAENWTTWLVDIDNNGNKIFYVQVPCSDAKKVQIQRFGSEDGGSCNKWWNSVGDVNASDQGNKNTITSWGTSSSNVAWESSESGFVPFKFTVKGDVGSWNTEYTLVDQLNGKFEYTLEFTPTESKTYAFKLLNSKTGWMGVDVSSPSLTAGATYDILLSYEVGKTLAVSATQKTFFVTASSANTNMGTVSPASAWVGSSAVTFTATPKTGYHWTSWSATGGASPSNAATSSVTATANGTITANFAENTYSITFNANGGSGSMTSQTGLGCATAQTINANAFTKTGYDFAGWATSADGNVVYTDQSTIPALTKTGNNSTLTLYAKWTAHTYSVTLNGNGGSAGSVQATYDGGLSNYSPASYNSKNLTGYYTAASEGELVIEATGALVSGTVTGWVNAGKWTNANETQTLYAQWQSEATLSFNKNTEDNVTNMPSNITKNPGDVTLPAGPTRVGYTFTGWNTLANGTGTTYAAGTTFDLQSNTELFAIWQINTHQLTWNTDGDELTGNYTHGDAIAYGTTIVKPDTPTKTGYTFKDWTNEVPETMPDNDLTFTATWTPNPNTAYKVEHYQQNIDDDDDYVLVDTDNLTGTTATEVTPDTKEYEGFTAPSKQTVTILADGSLVVEYKYTRNTHTLTWEPDGGTLTGTYTFGTVKYGTTITAPTASKFGKLFNAWSEAVPATMPDNDVTLTASYVDAYFFIEGRFHVANAERTPHGAVWTNTFSNEGWEDNSRTIPMVWNSTAERYEVKTFATPKELSTELGTQEQKTPWFYIKASESATEMIGAKAYYAATDEERKLTTEGNKSAVGTDTKYFYFDPETTITDKWTILCYDAQGVYFVLENIPPYYSINVKVADDQSAMGTVKPTVMNEINTLAYGTAKAESKDPQLYSFEKWGWTSNNQTEESFEFTSEIILHDSCQNTWPEIRVNAAGTDLMLIAHFKEREIVTIYFVDSENWGTNIRMHLWGGFEQGTTWPGIKPNETDLTCNGHTVYSYTFDKGAYEKVKWSNNGNDKSSNFIIDQELPYYNEHDGRWYDALSSIGPDKTICSQWRVVFNNSDEYFKLVEGQAHVYECFLANVPAWEKEGDNWVKMRYKPSGDWEWRGFTDISNNQKVESYVSATYTASTNNSDQNQLNLAGIAEDETQDFVLTFNTSTLQLTISYPEPKVEIGVKNQEGTAITEYDIDSEDGFLLNAYPQNVDKGTECTYSFQYQKDGGSWTTISGATAKSSTIMGSQLDGPGVYKFKVTMTISGQQYTSQETGNVTIYKYYWVAIKDNKNDNETSHWASYLHCWGPSGNKLAWPGESISNPTTGDLKTRDGWIYFRLKYPNYNKVLLTNGKTSDSGKDEVKTNDIEINPSAALCYKITGDQYWDESKQRSIWPTSTAGCPHRIFIDNDVNEYWMSVDGALSIAPKITYYGTGHLTYTWSTDATNLVLSATDKPNVSILASAVAAKATLTLTVTDGVDEKHYDFYISTQNGINIRVWKCYNDWTPVIRIWNGEHKAEHHNMNNEGNGWYSYPVADSWTSVNFMVMKNDNSTSINLECTADVSGVTESGCWKVSTEQWENQKHKIDKTEDCGLYYRVEETLADGKTTYHSNKVKKANEVVSFYAAQDGKLALQHYDETQGKYVDVKTLSNPTESNVQQATFTGNDITGMTKYMGDYYIRTDGAAGGWNNYRQAGNKFTSFTRNPLFGNEKYNYYWVTTIKDGKNAKAEVGNEINKCLAQTIGDYNCNQGAANVRFGYCPETNYFTRAIIAGSNVADYLTLYGDNSTYFNGGQDNSTLYTDEQLTHKIYDGSQLKFRDLSDWVYEAEVYAAVDVTRPSDTKAVIKSKYHDQIDYLLGYDSENQRPSYAYTVLGNTSTKNMTFKITVTYDYKMNRLTTAWMPLAGVISGHLDVDAAIMFLNQVDVDDQVQQITVEDKNSDISSLNNIVYVMEFEETDDVKGQNKETNHWISLPFDCRISDIYGIEGYVTLNNNKMPTDGVWGIQRYDGATRATKGRMKETDTYWTWMGRDEELKAGEGYVLSFDRGAIDWPEIEGTRIKRLYFQSKTAGFTLNLSKEDATQEVAEHVENVSLHRYGEDANWNLIGPLAYNNITIKEWTDKKDAPKFLYEYLGKEATYIEGIGKYKLVNPLDNEPETEAPFQFHSFHSYMVQFAGDINWAQYTQTQQDNPATAPLMATADAEFTYTQVRLNLSKGAQLMDKTYVCLSATGTTGYDLNDDLSKITEAKANQLGSIVEGRIYAANTLPLETEMVTLYVNAASAGEYTIALSQENPYLEIKLFDAFEQTTTLLDLMPATVTLEKGEYKDRFFLQLTQKAPQSPTSLDGSLEQYNLPMDKTQKLLINGNIYLINAGRVYNATGAELR